MKRKKRKVQDAVPQAMEFIRRLTEQPEFMRAIAAKHGDFVAVAATQGFIFSPADFLEAGRQLAAQSTLSAAEMERVVGGQGAPGDRRQKEKDMTRSCTDQMSTQMIMQTYNMVIQTATNFLAAYSKTQEAIAANFR